MGLSLTLWEVLLVVGMSVLENLRGRLSDLNVLRGKSKREKGRGVNDFYPKGLRSMVLHLHTPPPGIMKECYIFDWTCILACQFII